MKITQQVLTSLQLTESEWTALHEAENLVRQIYDSYNVNIMLKNPNTGECVSVDELPRVLGILSFFAENRVIEISPK